MKKKKTIKKLLTYIAIFIFSSSFAIPVFLTVTNSFMKEEEVVSNYSIVFGNENGANKYEGYISKEVHLNFVPNTISTKQYSTALLMSPEYLWKFWNSFFLVMPIVLGQVIISVCASYFFCRLRNKLTEKLFLFYILLMLLPFQVMAVPQYIVAKTLGIYDTYWAIILPSIFSTFGVFLITKYMKRIPNEIFESTMIDGANEITILINIAIPLSKNAIVATIMLAFVDYWGMVEQPLIMLTDQNKYPLSVYLSQINIGEISLAFAVATFYMIPTILIMLYGEESLVSSVSCYRGIK